MAKKEVLIWALGEILGYSMTAISIISNVDSMRAWIMFFLVVAYWAIRAAEEGYNFYRKCKDEKKSGQFPST
jgi:hypothetical protein